MTKINTRELHAAIGRLLQAAEGQQLQNALMAGGFVIEGAAKANIVRYDYIDTGATLNSTQARPAGDEVHVGPTTEYAVFGELGIGQSPKPFMRRAADEHGDEALQAIAEHLAGAISGV